MDNNVTMASGGGGLDNDEDEASLDCVICYDAIDTEKNDYMLAPCNHIFHKQCLVQWIEVKNECPICRLNLPSL